MPELSLMTWNVRYFGHGTRGVRATDGQVRKVAAAIAGLGAPPDVIALQEVEQTSIRGGLGAAPQLQRFMDALHLALDARGLDRRYQDLYFPAHRYQLAAGPAFYTTGLAVLVAEGVDVEDHNADEPHDITHVRVPALGRFKQRRVAAHVRVRPQGAPRALDLFNTHLSLPAFFEGGFHLHAIPRRMGHGSNQLREVEALLRLVAERADGDHAVILGDFNSRPASPVYEALRRAGFVDAYAHHHGLDADTLEQTGTARFAHLRMHIDHLFSTQAVRWLDVAAHAIDGDNPFAGLSDHAPKLGRLSLR
ncbi:MAG: endonuclease/exonuclease/phosphatase family protein [Alphaproteobacteria bacterium]|nr:endonuclease/exonuclease/phosphatase family protein [Alphaproteobacteria bacterium]